MKPTADAHPGVLPHQLLAAYVVKQALADLQSPSAVIQTDARRFLDGSLPLHFWCDVAGLDFASVVAQLQPRVQQVTRTGFGRAA